MLRSAGRAGVVDDVLHDVLEGRAALRPQVVPIEAHPDDAAPPRDLGDGGLGQLPVSGHQLPRVAV